MLFASYIFPLGDKISRFKGISCHSDAGDIQLYISFPQNVAKLFVLVYKVYKILDGRFLQLNTDKTELLISAPAGVVPKVMESLGSLSSPVKRTLCILGVSIGQVLSLDQHINCLNQSCF